MDTPPAAGRRYYAHDAVLDKYGVIAPWYKQPNGQCDFRVRIAAETLKRYPWTTTDTAIAAYPDYLFTSKWHIDPDGKITPQDPGDWMNGDLGQRSVSVLKGMVQYYQYTGDAAAIAHMTYMGNFLLDDCLTPAGHPWPNFPISVPTKGKAYGKASPDGMIQLDICADMGLALLQAYQVTGNQRWFDAVRHWGDLFAERCNLDPANAPWTRYANPDNIFTFIVGGSRKATSPKKDTQTGGVTMILSFLDELIRLNYTGKNNCIVAARDAGRKYLSDVLLPQWTKSDTWAYYFWDWLNNVQNCSTTADVSAYILRNKDLFPNWRNDVRNILTLFLNHTSVNPDSSGDVYSGAWAYPESSSCCGKSLWYAPLLDGATMAQYSVEADSKWAREIAYRQLVLQTYDAHENGVTEDNISGGVIVNGNWLNIAHPLPLLWVLKSIAWLPEELAPSRENHLVRSTAVVDHIVYDKDAITYSTFDAPAKTKGVLRLSFTPQVITADGQKLNLRKDLQDNGYTVKPLPNGDAIVEIRHDSLKNVTIKGSDPQSQLHAEALTYTGPWAAQNSIRFAETQGASVTATFHGNQVRILGKVDTLGGHADVYIDGEKQLAPIDCWNPAPREMQLLFYRNGLNNGPHTLKVVARGTRNPYSTGTRVSISAVQSSAEDRSFGYPSGTGSTAAQRMILGYTSRQDYKDKRGNSWRPGTEVVTRLGPRIDTVDKCWWKDPSNDVTGTSEPELYRYGYHAREFWVNLTVGPGAYDVRLRFANTRDIDPNNTFTVLINGQTVERELNVTAEAGGKNRALDKLYKSIAPVDGIIQVRFKANDLQNGQAFVQALEIEPRLSS
ncbi:MAG: malectin domain-containing carbohydrate-binding protein [Acidobacteriota bacterium]